MRKRIVGGAPPVASPVESVADWLPVEQLATIEVTSEEPAHPVENALLDSGGWRAALPGEQSLRLVFDYPQRLERIRLLFIELERERSQEFVLRWSLDGGQTFREIVRQQWNFSPHGSTQEIEDYRVGLSGVTQLELQIVPDRGGGDARASLAQLRLG